MVFVSADVDSSSCCDQNDTIMESIESVWNKLSINLKSGGFLVWWFCGTGGCPGNPSRAFVNFFGAQTIYNPSESDHSRGRSGDPNLLPSQLGTECSGPSFENYPPVSSFPGGVEVLYDCSEAMIDICFVHLLTGNRDNTWQREK
jgi:hypothetical protein